VKGNRNGSVVVVHPANLYFTDAEIAVLKAAAKARKLSMSEYVSRLVLRDCGRSGQLFEAPPGGVG
jgi:hypothetical protein